MNPATGPDEVSTTLLKCCAPAIVDHLANIFNTSLKSGTVPDEWKVSRITPIFKKGNASLVSNYRPISLFSLVGKLLERVVHSALLDHIIKESIISDSQFGFRPNSSTQEALLSMTRFWHNTMEAGGSNICVFLDLAKAFDSVPHDRVITSLSTAGVTGKLLQWFRSYLENRQQFVAIQGGTSSPAAVSSGVPQGSILGPLLFILVFDGIFRLGLSASTNLTGFADDVTYSKATFCDSDIAEVVPDLEKINSWLGRKFLSLNLDKVKAMVITRKKNRPAPNISLQGHCIEQVSSFKLLGVTVSDDLSWRDHILSVCARSKKLLGFIYRAFGVASKSCLNQLYKSLVLPVLDYSSAVWDPPHKIHQEALEGVQSFAAKIVSHRWNVDSDQLKLSLLWPSHSTRRLVQKLCVCHSIVSGSSLIPANTFTTQSNRVRCLRDSNVLFKPYVRTLHHRSSFFIDAITKWNSVPVNIRSLTSHTAFKMHLKILYN